jgi:hypothetical protein
MRSFDVVGVLIFAAILTVVCALMVAWIAALMPGVGMS